MTLSSAAGIALEVDSADAFSVREFHLEDGLSLPFQLDVIAASSNAAVDFEETIGRDATLRLDLHPRLGLESPARVWKGIVAEVHQLGEETAGLSTYSLTIVPRLWLLMHRTNCRVFQQQTDLEVARAVLGEWGLDPLVECHRAQKPRKYRVQYQESDYAFVCRMLEASGVTFLHRQVGDESKLVLVDAPEKAKPRKEPLEHAGEPALGTVWASRLRASRRIRHGKVTFADHDHRLPNQPLLGKSTTGDHPVEARLERFQYAPGSFRFGNKGPADTPHADDRGRTRTDGAEAQRIADQTAAALVARSQRFTFDSNALDLAAGSVVRLVGHARAEQHPELLITRIAVSGTFDREPTLAADAVDAARPYAPEAVTPQPVVQGVESATVVGPPGETIHCDEFGRVRVQFHWDRYGKADQFSSCWVHVNQPWAGDGLGAINIPRAGQEVIVDFLGGNPEEPIIVGRTYTNLLRPPFPLPQNKTQNGFRSASVPHTGGYNELMFEDMAGSELLRMRAEKDMATRVNHDNAMSVGRDRQATIERHDAEHVEGNQKHKVDGNLASAVDGQHTSQVGADQLMSVLGSLVSMAGGQRILQTLGAFASQALSHQITSETGTTITVGQSMIHIGPDSIVIQSPKVLLNPGEEVAAGAALGAPAPAPAEG